MKESTLFLICLASLAVIVALSSSAFAGCSSCMKEGDWSQSANAFLEGKTVSDEPVDFGPKAARQTSSQFENSNDAKASDRSTKIVLQSVNATPDAIEANGTARITAVFVQNGTTAEDQKELQLTATATIKDSTGKEIRKLNLIKSAANEYSNSWAANVPEGVYSVDIAASSLDGASSFADALQINVISPATSVQTNATETAAASQNSS
ncbi:MAG: hypothetical protein QG666_1158 [Euryarchaeota archaeon]|nr:hypothetical protein [Euryarchaeota archaeon]